MRETHVEMIAYKEKVGLGYNKWKKNPGLKSRRQGQESNLREAGKEQLS